MRLQARPCIIRPEILQAGAVKGLRGDTGVQNRPNCLFG